MSLVSRNLVAFLIVTGGVITLSLAMATSLNVREASTILLFVPLLWGYMILRLPCMIVLAVAIAIVRVLVELLQLTKGASAAITEAIFPIALYFGLLVPFFLYRQRQAVLFRKLLEAREVEARERLASSLAHDFNNVLSVILGTAQLLSKDRSLSLESAKDVNTILTAAQQGADLVRQMGRQAIAPLESQDRTLTDLSDVVDRQLVIVERMLKPDVHVVRQLSDAPLLVRVNVSHVLRVLLNLCINARDAMQGQGRITIRTGTSYRSGNGFAELSVSDTGPGIDPGVQRRMFEPFFTTKGQQGGVGLGLSIVQSIASAHGGCVEVDSPPGQGATFRVLFPLQQSPVSA